MKIYGKNLPEILAEMPWQLKIIVMVGMMWIPFALIHATYIFSTIGKSLIKPGMVNFGGAPINASVADPSLVATPDQKNVYMALTIITHFEDKNNRDGRWAPGIHIASSRQPCKVWTYVGTAAPATHEVVIGPDGVNPLDPDSPEANWWLEQPSLVYDPGDPGREYKLYYYKYLWLDNDEKSKALSRIYGMIAYRYAMSPDMRQWSQEQWIFSAKAKTADFHGNPPDPYNSLIQYHLDDFDPSLKDMWFYSRPSVALYQGVLYMTLSGFTQSGMTPDRVILLNSPDHGRTWHYVGKILDAADAAKMGPYTKLGGGTLIEKGGKIYFSAVLGDAKVEADGAFVIPFDDIAKAALQRDKNGAPVVINHIGRVSVKPSNLGGGYAAYSDACKGVYVSEFSGLKQNIHIFQTTKDPVEH